MSSMREDALCVVMSVAPGTLSRNKYFDLFRDRDFVRARKRSTRIRSVARELGHVPGDSVRLEAGVLVYAQPALGYTRRVQLARIDCLIVARLIARTDISALPYTDAAKAELERLVRTLEPVVVMDRNRLG